VTGVHDDLTNSVSLMIEQVNFVAIADMPARIGELLVNEDPCLILRLSIIRHQESR
jgi:hypothetical protein